MLTVRGRGPFLSAPMPRGLAPLPCEHVDHFLGRRYRLDACGASIVVLVAGYDGEGRIVLAVQGVPRRARGRRQALPAAFVVEAIAAGALEEV